MRGGDIVKVVIETEESRQWSYLLEAEGRVGVVDSGLEGSLVKDGFYKIVGLYPPESGRHNSIPAIHESELEPATREELTAQEMLDELAR